MQFFRHDSDMHTTEFGHEVIQELGCQGYGALCILMELYYQKVDLDDPDKLQKNFDGCNYWVEYRFSEIQRATCLAPRVLRKTLQLFTKFEEIFQIFERNSEEILKKTSKEKIRFCFPKLLKKLARRQSTRLSTRLHTRCTKRTHRRAREKEFKSVDSLPNGSESSAPPKNAKRQKKQTQLSLTPTVEKKGLQGAGVSGKTSQAIAHYIDRWRQRYDSTGSPTITGKEAGIFKQLMQPMGLDKTCAYIDAYFDMPDSWVVKKGHPVEFLLTKKQEIWRYLHTGGYVTATQARTVDEQQYQQNQSQLENNPDYWDRVRESKRDEDEAYFERAEQELAAMEGDV